MTEKERDDKPKRHFWQFTSRKAPVTTSESDPGYTRAKPERGFFEFMGRDAVESMPRYNPGYAMTYALRKQTLTNEKLKETSKKSESD